MVRGEDPIGSLDGLLDGHLPQAIATVLGLLIVGGVVYTGVKWIAEPIAAVARRFRGKTGPAERQAATRRRNFARHLAAQVERMNQKEEWRDDRFAELEAEVEAEGRQRGWARLVRGLTRQNTTLRRERSLSRALRQSDERLILVVGDPGAGKTVALRHVALSLASAAGTTRGGQEPLPAYINLKSFHPADPTRVTADDVRDFIKSDLKKVRDRDVDRFVDQEFDRILTEGQWVFLFDSFDEIPAILGSTEADEIVRVYSDAIYDFLNGVHGCRGVIASRGWRAPKESGWVRFKIVRMSWGLQQRLIRKADLDADREDLILSELPGASHEVRRLAENPLFLGLLCDYLRERSTFPSNPFAVFHAYVNRRLTRDCEQIHARFGLSPDDVQDVAERISYAMASSVNGLGLIAGRDAIRHEMGVLGISAAGLDAGIDALEYVKLLRVEEDDFSGGPASRGGTSVTFVHRRFQEYFATCLVLRDAQLVSAATLLTDGRWREAAVTILETQEPHHVQFLLDEARIQLSRHIAEAEDPPSPDQRWSTWPAGALHLIGILDAGLGARTDVASDELRSQIDVLLKAGWAGAIWDRRAALTVAGAGSQDQLESMIAEAFESRSGVLAAGAYQQVGRLGTLSDSVALAIRRTLLAMFAEGRLRRDRAAIDAHLRRMDRPRHFLAVKRQLVALPVLDILILGTLMAAFVITGQANVTWLSAAVVIVAIWSLPFLDRTLAGGLAFRMAVRVGPVMLSEPRFTWMLGLIIRCYAVAIIGIELDLGPWVPFIAPSGDVVCSVVLVIWGVYPLGALLASRSGDLLSPWLWFLHPLYPVVWLARGWPAVGKAVRALGDRRVLLAGVFTIAVVSAFIGLMLGPLYLIETGGRVRQLFGFAMYGCLGILVVLGLVAVAIESIKDWLADRRVRSAIRSQDPGLEVIDLLLQISSGNRCARLVNEMRRSPALIADRQVGERLRLSGERVDAALGASIGHRVDDADLRAKLISKGGDAEFVDALMTWDAARTTGNDELLDAIANFVEELNLLGDEDMSDVHHN